MYRCPPGVEDQIPRKGTSMSDITIGRGVRSNLLTLQNIAQQRETIQARLATGKKVNSALDNPTNFFTANSLNARAGDLSNLLDSMSNAVKTIEAADKGIKAITKLVESAQATVRQAQQTTDTAQRNTLMAQFNTIQSQIADLAEDSGFNGKNLLGGDSVKVVFNEKTGSSENSLNVVGANYTGSSPLSIATIATGTAAGWNGTVTDTSLTTSGVGAMQASADGLATALTTLRTFSAQLGANLSTVQARQDFTRDLVNTLRTGADNLTLADQNEEGANLLALNTRAQLSTTALSFASQADQQVLQFLR